MAEEASENGKRRIVGYAYASPFHERAAYAWTAETSIYVASDCRGRGIGTLLYRRLEEMTLSLGIRVLYACVACTSDPRDPHLTNASYAFHVAHGYREVGRFTECGWKFNRWYDMTFLEKRILSADIPMH